MAFGPLPACEAGWPMARQGGKHGGVSMQQIGCSDGGTDMGRRGAPIVAGTSPSSPFMCTLPIHYPTAALSAPFLSPSTPILQVHGDAEQGTCSKDTMEDGDGGGGGVVPLFAPLLCDGSWRKRSSYSVRMGEHSRKFLGKQ